MSLHTTHGFWPVTAAIGGNATVTVIKFIAALASGSSSMFSEAIHSFADTINQILLLIGLGRSTKKADDEFEYGYGNERFFWALISACGVLFVGAGVTVYNGINALYSPAHIEFSGTIFLVLLISFIIESYTLWIATRSLIRSLPNATWRERIRLSDPVTLSVVLEDAVAVIGVLVASLSLVLSYYTQNPLWDAGGSVVIGVLLGLVSITLIAKNRSHLIGRSIPADVQKGVEAILRQDPVIERVLDFKSSSLGMGVYRIKCEIELNGSAFLRDLYRNDSLRKEYEKVSKDFEIFKRFSADFVDRVPRLIGKKIDELEAEIKKAYPEIRHIDIEIN